MASIYFSGAAFLSLLVCPSVAAAQQPEPVEAIMAKVAQNQDRAQEIRSAFVYNQTLLIRFQRGDRKTSREELRNFSVFPTANGTQKTLTRFQGKYLKDGKLIEYTEPGLHLR